MPKRAQSFCQHPGCRAVAEWGGLCSSHRQERKAESWQRFKEKPVVRGNANARGYTARWGKARAAYLAVHPLCRECKRNGLFTPATVVDHIQPHRGDLALFWDSDNWQPLCASCHSRKTLSEIRARAR